jgi:hypothetical protein
MKFIHFDCDGLTWYAVVGRLSAEDTDWAGGDLFYGIANRSRALRGHIFGSGSWPSFSYYREKIDPDDNATMAELMVGYLGLLAVEGFSVLIEDIPERYVDDFEGFLERGSFDKLLAALGGALGETGGEYAQVS